MKISQITVEEFTTPSPVSVSPTEKLPAVWDMMQEKGIRHVLVSEDDQVVGIVSERDVTTFSQADYFEKVHAQDIMSQQLLTVTPETRLYEVALKMSQEKVGSALVTTGHTDEVGIFTATDALNALVEILRGDFSES